MQDDPPAAVVTISGIAHAACSPARRPGEAADRLDLAKLRQLVDRVEARDAAAAACSSA